MKTLRTLLIALVSVVPVFGNLPIFPTYSTPVLVNDTLIVLSVDRMALISMSKSGREIWRRQLSSKGSLITHSSGEILLIEGGTVSSFNPKDGSIVALFSSDPKVKWLEYAYEANLFWGPLEGDGAVLALFDGVTHSCLATEKHGETVAYADADLIVLAKGRRKTTEGGDYSFSKGWVEAFNRKTMKKVWAVQFENQPWPYHVVVRCGAYVVCEDDSDLMVIDVKTGEVRRCSVAKHKDADGPHGLGDDNGALTYFTSKIDVFDLGKSEEIHYKLSLPDLKVLESRVIRKIEVESSEKVGGLLITDGHRTACFRQDGTRLWDYPRMDRTSAVDGVIYFSDYNKGVARMGALDVATGTQRFFLSEEVEKKLQPKKLQPKFE